MALKAGVDLLLHPTHPERIVSYLEKTNYRPKLITKSLELRTKINSFQFSVLSSQFEEHRKLSEELTRRVIRIEGDIKHIKGPFLIILNDEERGEEKDLVLAKELKRRFPDSKLKICRSGSDIPKFILRKTSVIVAVFSGVKAWKGGPSPWLLKCIKELEEKAEIFISFGSPYIFDGVRDNVTKIYAYWDSDSAQKAVAELI